jgi:hypothetical protein
MWGEGTQTSTAPFLGESSHLRSRQSVLSQLQGMPGEVYSPALSP